MPVDCQLFVNGQRASAPLVDGKRSYVQRLPKGQVFWVVKRLSTQCCRRGYPAHCADGETDFEQDLTPSPRPSPSPPSTRPKRRNTRTPGPSAWESPVEIENFDRQEAASDSAGASS